ncbi:MAG: hypothetical protein ABSG68_05040 [Thermoguttaceae bacterium]
MLLPVAFLRSRGAGLGTGALWCILTLAGLWLVSAYGLTTPYGDEWNWIGQVTGDEAVTWSWLWALHSEHRMFLPRLIYLGLGQLSGFNFRAGAYFNIVLLSAVSLAMMCAVRRRRGAASWYDAVFPVAMLQWGSFTNLIWGFQLNFVVSITLSTAVLLLIFCCRKRLSIWTACSITLCLLGAGLCGAYGLAFLPPLAAWLLLVAVLPAGDGGRVSPGYRIGLGCLAAVLAGFCTCYFLGFHRPAIHAAAPSVAAALRTSCEFLAGALGPAGKESWPLSGLLVLAACGLAVLPLLRTLMRRPEERFRAAGLLAWLAAVFVLAAGIGWGRSFIGPGAGFANHYMVLTASLLCFFALVWNAYASPRWLPHLQRCLLLLACVSFLVGVHKGPRCSAEIFDPLRDLERDAQAGIPPAMLAVRYADRFAFNEPLQKFTRWLEMLRTAKLGPYRGRPLQSLEPVVVECLVELPRPKGPVHTITIAPGNSFVQPVKAAHSGTLYRVDLQLAAFRRKYPEKLEWTLLRVAPQGAREVLASGEIGLTGLVCDDMVTLVCPPRRIEAGQELELKLRNPAADGTRIMSIFGYDAASPSGPLAAINGYLFLEQDRMPAH